MPKISPQPYTKLLKIFEKEGWLYLGTVGDHLQLKKTGFPRRVVIPKKKEVPVFIILNNLRTAKMNRERYLELLSQT